MRISKSIFEYCLPVKVQEDNGSYFAVCSSWSDCYAQGETPEEAINELVAVAKNLIEIYREEKLTITMTKKVEKILDKDFSLSGGMRLNAEQSLFPIIVKLNLEP